MRQPGALGQAFGATPAAGGLAGKLPRRGGQPAQGAATVPAPAPAPPAAAAVAAAPVEVDQGQAVEQPQAAAPATSPSSAAPNPQAAGDDLAAEPTYQVSVYVLPDIVRAAEALRRRTRGTNADIAYDALDAMRGRLGELVAARRGGPQRAADSMFPGRRSRNVRAAAAVDGRRQLWSFQATEGELDVIDALVEQHGARSRSELVSVAVEAHLGRRRARGR